MEWMLKAILRRPAKGATGLLPSSPILAGIAVLTVLGLASFLFVDSHLFVALSPFKQTSRHHPFLRAFMEFGKVWPLIWIGLFLAWARSKPRMLVALVLAVVTAGSVGFLIKLSVGRLRPGKTQAYATDRIRQGKRLSYSFPSGDTAATVAMVAVLTIGTTGTAYWLPWILAFGVCALRVISLRHFPSDIMGGFIIGMLAAHWAVWLEMRLPIRAPPHWRNPTFFWVSLLFPVTFPIIDVMQRRPKFWPFFTVFGPIFIVIVLWSQGPLWQRWARSRSLQSSAATRMKRATPLLVRLILCLWVSVVALWWVSHYRRSYDAQPTPHLVEMGLPQASSAMPSHP
jgi:membrane-associated phospholipid phosphatase